jgi:hypothetical protein
VGIPGRSLASPYYRFLVGGVCGVRLRRLPLVHPRSLLLELVHLPDPPAYGVGFMERHSGASRRLVSSSGEAGRRYYPRLLAAVVPRAGEDLLHRLVSNGPLVILALDRDALAVVAHDDVDALVPSSSEHRRPVAHRLEELGDEDL